MKPIAILGVGAIGQLISWQLRHHAPILLGRLPAPKQLCFIDSHKQRHYYQADYRQVSTAKITNIKLLIVTVKAYQVQQALQPFIKKFSSDCSILLLHNGMGSHLDISLLAEQRPLILGTTSQGALRSDTWTVQHTGQGVTQVGQFSGTELSTQYQTMLNTSIPDFQWCENILEALWQKLAVNAVINPLTVINNCRNGELASAKYAALIESTVAELIPVAAAEGIILHHEQLLQRIYQVISLTANNFSSMHQDVLYKRKTEIDAINGYIVKRARLHGLAAPVNQQICEKISMLTRAKIR